MRKMVSASLFATTLALHGSTCLAAPGDIYAQLAQLQTIFASGTCDYTKPGVGQQPVVQWSRWP